MEQLVFVERRGGAWRRLEALLDRTARRGVRRLAAGEIAELGRLYRWVTSDLAYARGRRYDARLVAYLNRLTARAHAIVYGGSVQSGRERVWQFFRFTFPHEFRRSFGYIAICAALTIVCATVAYAVVARHPGEAYALLPSSLVPAHIAKSLHDSHFAFGPTQSAAMSALIITNNIRVAILAFAAGIVTLGVATIYLIVFNALTIGALGALYAHAGFGYDFWATVAPHGAIELTAIQIAGGAGLLVAAGVLYPGRLRRKDALAANARRAGVLIAGVAAMLCVAGTIEGFFSPLRFPAGVRAAVGALTAVLLLAYFGFAGRSRRTDPDAGPSVTY